MKTEGLDPGSRYEGGSGLVESDVSIGPDAADEEMDATRLPDLPFKLLTFDCQVRGVSWGHITRSFLPDP